MSVLDFGLSPAYVYGMQNRIPALERVRWPTSGLKFFGEETFYYIFTPDFAFLNSGFICFLKFPQVPQKNAGKSPHIQS